MPDDKAMEESVRAVVAQRDGEIRRYLNNEMPANQWRPEAYAQAAVEAYLGSLVRDLPERAIEAAVGETDTNDEWMRHRLKDFLRALTDGGGRD